MQLIINFLTNMKNITAFETGELIYHHIYEDSWNYTISNETFLPFFKVTVCDFALLEIENREIIEKNIKFESYFVSEFHPPSLIKSFTLKCKVEIEPEESSRKTNLCYRFRFTDLSIYESIYKNFRKAYNLNRYVFFRIIGIPSKDQKKSALFSRISGSF